MVNDSDINILILLIKSLKRSIKVYDIYIEKNKKSSE